MNETTTQRWTRVIDHDFTAAIGLVGGVVVALGWSGFSPSSYFRLLNSPFHVGLANDLDLHSAHDIVINLLMSLFFFAIGLEISREFAGGIAHVRRQAIPPIVAAIGGMTVTSLGSIGLGVALHSEALRRGWGVPMATDVAFTLAVLAVAGRRLPRQIRIFVLTLAVTDDVLSALVLSLSGVSHPRPLALAGVVVISVAALVARTRMTPRWGVVVLITLWLCFGFAHVEPALAGVLAGVLVSPTLATRGHLERRATRLSNTVVLPLFAVAACGIHWSDLHWRGAGGTVIYATIGLRLVGKTLGITAGVALARLGHFKLHRSLTWAVVVNIGLLCAIGFTVPLLFANRLFGDQSSLYASFDVGLLISSLVAALVGGAFIRTHRVSD